MDQRHCQAVSWRPSGNSSRQISILPSGSDQESVYKIRPFSLKVIDQRGCLGQSYLKMRTVSTVEKLLQELYTYESMRNAGVITPSLSIGHLIVTIGTRDFDFGLVVIEEPIDDRFITKYFPQMQDPDLWKALSK